MLFSLTAVITFRGIVELSSPNNHMKWLPFFRMRSQSIGQVKDLAVTYKRSVEDLEFGHESTEEKVHSNLGAVKEIGLARNEATL